MGRCCNSAAHYITRALEQITMSSIEDSYKIKQREMPNNVISVLCLVFCLI